jgi:hypothetical protein
MELFDSMVGLNTGDTLDARTAGRLLESIAAVADELERLHGRIQMVGLPLAADADRIVVSTGRSSGGLRTPARSRVGRYLTTCCFLLRT